MTAICLNKAGQAAVEVPKFLKNSCSLPQDMHVAGNGASSAEGRGLVSGGLSGPLSEGHGGSNLGEDALSVYINILQ